jgi:hypothetical protein
MAPPEVLAEVEPEEGVEPQGPSAVVTPDNDVEVADDQSIDTEMSQFDDDDDD